MLADTLPVVLGIIGVVAGTVGAVVGFFAYLRDRPKLALVWYAHLGESPFVYVTVVNQGRRPTSIQLVGVDERRSILRRWFPFVGVKGLPKYTRSEKAVGDRYITEEPQRLDSGEHYRASLRFADVATAFENDAECEPFAIEVSGLNGRTTWGPPIPIAELVLSYKRRRDSDPRRRQGQGRSPRA